MNTDYNIKDSSENTLKKTDISFYIKNFGITDSFFRIYKDYNEDSVKQFRANSEYIAKVLTNYKKSENLSSYSEKINLFTESEIKTLISYSDIDEKFYTSVYYGKETLYYIFRDIQSFFLKAKYEKNIVYMYNRIINNWTYLSIRDYFYSVFSEYYSGKGLFYISYNLSENIRDDFLRYFTQEDIVMSLSGKDDKILSDIINKIEFDFVRDQIIIELIADMPDYYNIYFDKITDASNKVRLFIKLMDKYYGTSKYSQYEALMKKYLNEVSEYPDYSSLLRELSEFYVNHQKIEKALIYTMMIKDNFFKSASLRTISYEMYKNNDSIYEEVFKLSLKTAFLDPNRKTRISSLKESLVYSYKMNTLDTYEIMDYFDDSEKNNAVVYFINNADPDKNTLEKMLTYLKNDYDIYYKMLTGSEINFEYIDDIEKLDMLFSFFISENDLDNSYKILQKYKEMNYVFYDNKLVVFFKKVMELGLYSDEKYVFSDNDLISRFFTAYNLIITENQGIKDKVFYNKLVDRFYTFFN